MDPFIASFMVFTLFIIGLVGMICAAVLTRPEPVVIFQAPPDDDDDGEDPDEPAPEEPEDGDSDEVVDWDSFDRERTGWVPVRS